MEAQNESYQEKWTRRLLPFETKQYLQVVQRQFAVLDQLSREIKFNLTVGDLPSIAKILLYASTKASSSNEDNALLSPLKNVLRSLWTALKDSRDEELKHNSVLLLSQLVPILWRSQLPDEVHLLALGAIAEILCNMKSRTDSQKLLRHSKLAAGLLSCLRRSSPPSLTSRLILETVLLMGTYGFWSILDEADLSSTLSDYLTASTQSWTSSSYSQRVIVDIMVGYSLWANREPPYTRLSSKNGNPGLVSFVVEVLFSVTSDSIRLEKYGLIYDCLFVLNALLREDNYHKNQMIQIVEALLSTLDPDICPNFHGPGVRKADCLALLLALTNRLVTSPDVLELLLQKGRYISIVPRGGRNFDVGYIRTLFRFLENKYKAKGETAKYIGEKLARASLHSLNCAIQTRCPLVYEQLPTATSLTRRLDLNASNPNITTSLAIIHRLLESRCTVGVHLASSAELMDSLIGLIQCTRCRSEALSILIKIFQSRDVSKIPEPTDLLAGHMSGDRLLRYANVLVDIISQEIPVSKTGMSKNLALTSILATKFLIKDPLTKTRLVELRLVSLLIEVLEAANSENINSCLTAIANLISESEAAKTQFLSWTSKQNGKSARSLLISLWTSLNRSNVIPIAPIRWMLTVRMQMSRTFYRPNTKTESSLVAKEDFVEIAKRKIFVVCFLISASDTPDQISRDQIPILYQIKTYEACQVLSALQQAASNLQRNKDLTDDIESSRLRRRIEELEQQIDSIKQNLTVLQSDIDSQADVKENKQYRFILDHNL